MNTSDDMSPAARELLYTLAREYVRANGLAARVGSDAAAVAGIVELVETGWAYFVQDGDEFWLELST